MKFSSHVFATVCLMALLPYLLSGCGGASLDYGQQRNLESVEPNFADPAWFDAYEQDPSAAANKYKNKVLQVDLVIIGFEETSRGVEVRGATGEDDAYRIVCIFPSAASSRIQSHKAGDRIAVKGLFGGIEDAGNTYQLRLTSCVLVRK